MKAFRVEITTGMSAPPIGITASTPSAPADEQDQPEQQLGVGARGDHHRQRDRDRRSSAALTAFGIRRPRFISSCSFRKAMFEPQKEIEPMIAANRIGISASSRHVAARPRGTRRRDQRHRAAADAVEQRHHLRHRGHLHAARAPGRRPRCRSRRRPRSAPSRRRRRLQQRRDDRDRHADRRDLVAAHRRARPAQHPQAR